VSHEENGARAVEHKPSGLLAELAREAQRLREDGSHNPARRPLG